MYDLAKTCKKSRKVSAFVQVYETPTHVIWDNSFVFVLPTFINGEKDEERCNIR